MLLDAGAPKDLSNRLGWTALHEACFYNRMETVKTLLLSGANPTLRSRQGALPYHLACIPEIRSMLESMGGEGAGESIASHSREGKGRKGDCIAVCSTMRCIMSYRRDVA